MPHASPQPALPSTSKTVGGRATSPQPPPSGGEAVLVRALRPNPPLLGRLTLVTEIHLVALALVVVLASLAVRDWWRTENALPVEYPNWTELITTSGLFVAACSALIVRAAWWG